MSGTRLFFTTAVALCVVISARQSAAKDVLRFRTLWAPLFCYAGSANPVPKEFCGEDPETARPRFRTHRNSILKFLSGSDCEPKEKYSSLEITGDLKSNLHCTSNSYTEGNDDGWNTIVWNKGAGCTARKLGLNVTSYFQLMTDLYNRYDPDVALKKQKITLGKMKKIKTSKLLKALKKGLGQEGFITCDKATGKKYSTYSICLEPTPPYNITKCPSSMLKRNKSACPKYVKIERGHRSVSKPTADCLQYYPAFQ